MSNFLLNSLSPSILEQSYLVRFLADLLTVEVVPLGPVIPKTISEIQEVRVPSLKLNTRYQFRVRPSLVFSSTGALVGDGQWGPNSNEFKTNCMGKS